MSNETKSSGSMLPGLLVGAVLMVAGGWMAMNHQPEALYNLTKSLEEQGIPLDLGKTVSVIGVFLILFPVIKSFFLNPLSDAIHERTALLESTFTEAETLRSDMTAMRSDYERRLADSEASAREQIQAEIKKAQDLRTQLMAEAAAQKEEMVRKASEEIEAEKNRVLNDLRLHVVDLTLGATAKILGENVDDARNRRLIDEFIDKVEVPG